MTILSSGGIRPSRLEYVEEPTQGASPDNPAWQLVSPRVETLNPSMTVNYSEDAGLGDVNYTRAPLLEEPSLEMEYALSHWLTDSNGDPNNLIAYGMQRIAGVLPSSLTFLARTTFGKVDNDTSTPKLQAGSTVDARYNPDAADDGSDSTGKASRIYSVLKGMDVNEGTLTGERGESTWMAEVTCPAEHGRPYQFDQPNSSSTLVVAPAGTLETDGSSQFDSSTSLTVTIESEGGTKSEDVTFDPSAMVATTTDFSDIDSIEVKDSNGNVIDGESGRDYQGNIVVAMNTGDGTTPAAGEWLAVLWGSKEYGNTYGDPGTPSLGSGSHASEPTTPQGSLPFYHPNNMSIERPVGNSFETVGGVTSVELSFENGIEPTPTGGREQTNLQAMFAPEWTVSSSGETISQHMQHEQAAGTGKDTRVIFNRADDEYVDGLQAVVTETDLESSAGENNTEMESTIMPQKGENGEHGVQISSPGSGA